MKPYYTLKATLYLNVAVAFSLGAANENLLEFKALCDVFKQDEIVSKLNVTELPARLKGELDRVRRSVETMGTLVGLDQFQAVSISAIETTTASEGLPTKAGKHIKGNVNATTPFGEFVQKVAQAKIARIFMKLEEGGSIPSRITALTTTTKGDLQTAIEKAGEAMYGTGGKLSSNQGVTFKNTNGHTANAGHTLAQDMAWLCATHSSNNECTSKGNAAAGKVADTTTAHAMFTLLITDTENCKSSVQKVTSDSLTRAVAHFYTLLGAQAPSGASAATTPNINTIFGSFTASTTSDCAAGSSRVCINYGHVISGTSKTGIAWVERNKEVITALQKYEEAERQAEAIMERLWTLGNQSQEIYEEAKATEDFIPTEPPMRSTIGGANVMDHQRTSPLADIGKENSAFATPVKFRLSVVVTSLLILTH